MKKHYYFSKEDLKTRKGKEDLRVILNSLHDCKNVYADDTTFFKFLYKYRNSHYFDELLETFCAHAEDCHEIQVERNKKNATISMENSMKTIDPEYDSLSLDYLAFECNYECNDIYMATSVDSRVSFGFKRLLTSDLFLRAMFMTLNHLDKELWQACEYEAYLKDSNKITQDSKLTLDQTKQVLTHLLVKHSFDSRDYNMDEFGTWIMFLRNFYNHTQHGRIDVLYDLTNDIVNKKANIKCYSDAKNLQEFFIKDFTTSETYKKFKQIAITEYLQDMAVYKESYDKHQQAMLEQKRKNAEAFEKIKGIYSIPVSERTQEHVH